MKNIDDINFHHIIIEIPEDTVKLVVNAKILDGDELVTVKGSYTANEIFKARKDFLDNVEDGDDYDAVYVLTDEGRAWLEEHNES